MTALRAKMLVVAVAAGAMLAAPAVADASYYLTRAHAQSNARSYARERYASNGPQAYCRPQGLDEPEPGYIYHRWVCGWADADGCEGRLLITGSRGNYYYGRVLRGERCEP
jgi:hypothetical protein